MTDSPHVAALAGFDLFAELDPQSLEWLAANVEPVAFVKGDVLIQEGGTDRDCYLILDGTVEVVIGGAVAGQSVAGQPEGELGLLFRRPRAATSTAITPVTTLRLPADRFDALARSSPDIAEAIAARLIGYLTARFGYRPPHPWSAPRE